jgi:hypothetical protein
LKIVFVFVQWLLVKFIFVLGLDGNMLVLLFVVAKVGLTTLVLV